MKAIQRLVPKLYGMSCNNAKRVAGGRLSDTFTFTGDSGQDYFVKVSRPGNPENTQTSPIIGEYGREQGLPFPKTFPGVDGELFQIISPEDAPDLAGNTLTIVEKRQQTSISDEDKVPSGEVEREIGRYLGKHWRLKGAIDIIPAHLPTEDVLSTGAAIDLINRTFGLAPNDSNIQEQTSTLAGNLPDTELAQSFKRGILRGDVKKILRTMTECQQRIDKAGSQGVSMGFKNNDIKHNNAFFVYNPGTESVEITTAFDLDMISKGAYVDDLGRAIALGCFSPKTGQLEEDKMRSMIEGRSEISPLSTEESDLLGDFIRTGIGKSYALRASYFSSELRGEKNPYKIEQLDPSLHIEELASVDSFLRRTNLSKYIQDMQQSPEMLQHKAISDVEAKVIDSSTIRGQERLALFNLVDLGHRVVNNKPCERLFADQQDALKDASRSGKELAGRISRIIDPSIFRSAA